MNDENHIGKRFFEMMGHFGLSAAAIAKKAGVQPQTVSKNVTAWKKKRKAIMPDSATAQKICAAFPDIRIDWLLNGNGPMLQIDPFESGSKLDLFWRDKYNELEQLYRQKLEKIELLGDRIQELQNQVAEMRGEYKLEPSRKPK